MGTIVSQRVYGADEAAARETMARITEHIEATEQEISWRIEDSQISRINASAGEAAGCQIAPALGENFRQLWQLSRDSGGAFDLTIAPVVRLWDIDTWAVEGVGTLPTEDQIREKLACTGYEQVTFGAALAQGHGAGNSCDGSTGGSGSESTGANAGGTAVERIYLPEGYQLDLGAVGKGLACDRILELLAAQDKDIQGAVISLGGNILTYGSKPDGTAWKVGVVDPEKPQDYLGMLTLTGTHFVTTSGDYERYVEVDGVRYHHIIDPSTGYPADSGVCSVTILSDNGMLGDALSTACFVLGAEQGLDLAREYGAEILIVTDFGELIMSEGMRGIFQER